MDEGKLVDGLLAAMRHGETTRMAFLGCQLVDLWEFKGGARHSPSDSGLILPLGSEILDIHAAVNDGGIDLLADHLPESRLESLYGGAQATKREAKLWATLAAEQYFADQPDPDETWWIVQTHDSDGAEAFVAQLRRGSEYPCDAYFLGVCQSIEDALGVIRTLGYTDIDDFRERYPAQPGTGPTPQMANPNEMAALGYRDEFEHFQVCLTCKQLFEQGRPDGLDQQCRCDRKPQPKWTGVDFNERVSLCMCCGLKLLPSGSRYSPFFCDECRPMAIGVSLWHRQLVFPIGRHSFMHMWVPKSTTPSLAAHGGKRGKLARTVHTAITAVGGGIDLLTRWREKIVAHNLKVIDATTGISLAEYVSAVARVGALSSNSAFAEMCAFARSAPQDPTKKKKAVRRKASTKRRPTVSRHVKS